MIDELKNSYHIMIKQEQLINHAKWLRKRRSILQWYAEFLDGKAEMPVHDDGLDQLRLNDYKYQNT